MVNRFNNATSENSNDLEKIASSKYYDIDEMHKIETPHKNKPLSLFHINARNDLNSFKKNELESSFIEIFNPKKLNIIMGVIYRHPSMDLTVFNCNYLNKLLENISNEQKSIFLLGDFNVNRLNYNEHNQIMNF